MITRRALLVFVAATILPLAACKKEPRCSRCGMKIDSTSAWTAELAVDGEKRPFDTPRCAIAEMLATKGAKLRVQDFYDRVWRDGAEVRFVVGSDVLGPMGPDLVPVMPGRVEKMIKDHGGRQIALGEITPTVLDALQ
jgi:copper chaperone NosL